MLGRVCLNDVNQVKYWAMATELPQMVVKGSMRITYEKLTELEERLGLTRNHNP